MTPVPIPNTEVKLFSADGTARAAVWESRTPPNLSREAGAFSSGFSFFNLQPQPPCTKTIKTIEPHTVLEGTEDH